MRTLNVQCTRPKNRRDAHLPLYRHLQVPDQVDGNTQHGNIRHRIERRRGEIQSSVVQASPWELRRPDLGAWRAQKERDEEETDVEDRVHDDEPDGQPVAEIAVSSTEDAED